MSVEIVVESLAELRHFSFDMLSSCWLIEERVVEVPVDSLLAHGGVQRLNIAQIQSSVDLPHSLPRSTTQTDESSLTSSPAPKVSRGGSWSSHSQTRRGQNGPCSNTPRDSPRQLVEHSGSPACSPLPQQIFIMRNKNS